MIFLHKFPSLVLFFITVHGIIEMSGQNLDPSLFLTTMANLDTDLNILPSKNLAPASASLCTHCPIICPAQIAVAAHLDYCNILLNSFHSFTSTHFPDHK